MSLRHNDIYDLSDAYEVNPDVIPAWVTERLREPDPVLLGDVIAPTTNAQLTETKSKH